MRQKPRGQSLNSKYSEAVRTEARHLYEEGHTLKQVGEILSIPTSTVSGWCYDSRRTYHRENWDRKNGIARKNAKTISQHPELEKHVAGASTETIAAAAMLASVPANERHLLQHAIVSFTASNPKFFKAQSERAKAAEQSEINYHIKDCPDSVKAIAYTILQLAPDHIEAIRNVGVHLMDGITTTNNPPESQARIDPDYHHLPGSTPWKNEQACLAQTNSNTPERFTPQHQAATNAAIAQLRRQNTPPKVEGWGKPKAKPRRLNNR